MTILCHMARLLLCVSGAFLLLETAGCNLSPASYVRKGDKLYAAGNYAEASINYRKALQKDARFGEAYYGLALSELQARNLRTAYENMSRAAELLPNHPEAKIRLADLCLMLYLPDPKRPPNLYEQLASISQQLLAKDPKSFDGLRIKGHLALTEKKTAEAVEFFSRANVAKPMQPEVIMGLVEGLIELKRYAEAEKAAFDLIRNQKSFAPIYDVLYGLYRAMNRPADIEKILRLKVDNNPKVAGYLTQLAAYYYAAGKTAEMNAVLQRLKDHAQDFPRVHLILGDYYAGMGDFLEARHQLEQGAKDNPKDSEVYQKRLANLLLLEGKKDEAAALVEKILTANPLDRGSVDLRAALLLDAGGLEKIDRAVAQLKTAVERQPADSVSHYLLGRALLARGDLAEAAAQFLEAVKQKQDYLAPRLHLSEIGIQTRQYDRALRYANDALALQPDSDRAKLLRATAQIGLGKSKDAREELAALVRQRPAFVDARLQLGLLETRERRFKEAGDIFRALYRPGSKDLRALEGLVGVFVAQKDFDSALRLLNEEAKKSPNSVAVRNLLAVTAGKAGKLDVAREQYQQLAAANPGIADFQLGMGEIYLRSGEANAAAEAVEKALALAPKNAAVASLGASMLERAGHTDAAIAAYRRVLELQPDNPVVMNNLAYLLADSGANLDQALTLVRKAQQTMPDEPVLADTIGWIYVKKGMQKSAVQLYRNLARKDPDNPTYLYHYGVSLLADGDKKKAKQELEAALQKHPTKVEEARIRELIDRAR